MSVNLLYKRTVKDEKPRFLQHAEEEKKVLQTKLAVEEEKENFVTLCLNILEDVCVESLTTLNLLAEDQNVCMYLKNLFEIELRENWAELWDGDKEDVLNQVKEVLQEEKTLFAYNQLLLKTRLIKIDNLLS